MLFKCHRQCTILHVRTKWKTLFKEVAMWKISAVVPSFVTGDVRALLTSPCTRGVHRHIIVSGIISSSPWAQGPSHPFLSCPSTSLSSSCFGFNSGASCLLISSVYQNCSYWSKVQQRGDKTRPLQILRYCSCEGVLESTETNRLETEHQECGGDSEWIDIPCHHWVVLCPYPGHPHLGCFVSAFQQDCLDQWQKPRQ